MWPLKVGGAYLLISSHCQVDETEAEDTNEPPDERERQKKELFERKRKLEEEMVEVREGRELWH